MLNQKYSIYATGRLEVDNGVRIVTDVDICKYYSWFIKKEFPWIKTQLPMHGGHIALFNPKIHGDKDLKKVLQLDGKIANFYYRPNMLFKSPKNFWLPVGGCDYYQHVKDLLNFKEKANWLGLHLTVCNSKFNNSICTNS